MENKSKWEMINPEFIHIDLEVENQEELLIRMVEGLEHTGYVSENYISALMLREQNFPTGLETKSISVAIPHANREHVNKSVISVATLKNPIAFQAMGMHNTEVQVELVFLLAINNHNDQIDVLQKFMSIFSKPETLNAIKSSRCTHDIINILEQHLIG